MLFLAAEAHDVFHSGAVVPTSVEDHIFAWVAAEVGI